MSSRHNITARVRRRALLSLVGLGLTTGVAVATPELASAQRCREDCASFGGYGFPVVHSGYFYAPLPSGGYGLWRFIEVATPGGPRRYCGYHDAGFGQSVSAPCPS